MDSCLSFLSFPSAIKRCFSSRIRSNNIEAGSSFSSWGTNLPMTASCKIDFFNISGKASFNCFKLVSLALYLSIIGINSRYFFTIRRCSLIGGKGHNCDLSISWVIWFIVSVFTPSSCLLKTGESINNFTYSLQLLLYFAIKAPNAIPSLSTIALFPTRARLPFLAQMSISPLWIIARSGTSQET